jgi:hypothetical protein
MIPDFFVLKPNDTTFYDLQYSFITVPITVSMFAFFISFEEDYRQMSGRSFSYLGDVAGGT